MQKFSLLLFALFITNSASAQTTQKGLVREMNSGKKPMSGVSILFYDASATDSDGEGKFTVTFAHRLTPGSSLILQEVKKNGYELVNEKEFHHLKLSNDTQLATDVILAKAGLIDAARAEYAGASLTALRAGLEREKKKLIAQLSGAKLNADEYRDQLEALQKDFDQQQTLLNDYAEKFARTNFDDVDPVYQKALELYKEGKIKEAIAKIESIDPAKQTADILKEEKSIAKADAELNERKRVVAEKKKQQITVLRTLADMYSVDFNLLKAEEQIDQLLTLDSADLEILTEAADFYREQHRYEKAKRLYPKIIAHAQAEEWRKANAYSHLGELFIITGDLEKAITYFSNFSFAYADLYNSDSSAFNKSNLAISYSKLGSTHSALGNLDKALAFYEEDMKLTKELYEAYPSNVSFKNGLAISYSKLGSTHSALGNLDKALAFYEEDMKLTKELYEAYPSNVSFKNGLAISYIKLASIYLKTDVEKGVANLKNAEQHFRKLRDISPQDATFKKYHEMVVDVLNQMGASSKESVRTRQKIEEEKNPARRYTLYATYVSTLKTESASAPEISQALNSQAWYGLLSGHFIEAEALVKEGIALDSTNKYLYTNLPAALLLQGKTKEAIQLYTQWSKKPFGEQNMTIYKDAFLADLKDFEAAGIIPEARKKDITTVKDLLKTL